MHILTLHYSALGSIWVLELEYLFPFTYWPFHTTETCYQGITNKATEYRSSGVTTTLGELGWKTILSARQALTL